ncbi:neurofilament heavy polypeptide-like [Patiria miniata]|uniref:Uncharacterized protein n=1 Tax=Patiria miniata TaxID=46514 RepID=A0A914A5M9_PATMI|nr:neurofilament heavy polypeptide-like [Patiria miniata]
MKSVFIVVLVAIAAYFLFRPTTFTVKNDIFMYKSPEDVYDFMSDLKRTIEKHSIGGKCTLVKQRTRKDGVKEKLYLVEKAIPLLWDYEFPFNMEIRLTLSKPNEEVLYNFGFLRGYLLKVHSRMTFEHREGRAMPGTFLTEYLTITCPWLAQTLVEKNLKNSHKDTLVSLRNGLEGMAVARDKIKETGGTTKEEGKKTRTEKKKETATPDKKGKGAKKDEAKKSSGQEKKASKVSEQEKTKASKEEKRQTVDKKMDKKTSKDADVKPRRAEKEGETKQASETSRQEKKETVLKDKKPTPDKKTAKKATPHADVKPKQADDEKMKKVETREEETIAKDVKTEKAPGGEGTKEKDAGKRKEEQVKVEKESTRKDAKDVKRERKLEETVQKESESKESRMDGTKPEKLKESKTRGQKPQVPKAEKEKIVKPVQSEQKQNAKTGG